MCSVLVINSGICPKQLQLGRRYRENERQFINQCWNAASFPSLTPPFQMSSSTSSKAVCITQARLKHYDRGTLHNPVCVLEDKPCVKSSSGISWRKQKNTELKNSKINLKGHHTGSSAVFTFTCIRTIGQVDVRWASSSQSSSFYLCASAGAHRKQKNITSLDNTFPGVQRQRYFYPRATFLSACLLSVVACMWKSTVQGGRHNLKKACWCSGMPRVICSSADRALWSEPDPITQRGGGA